ncbi:hypothetical protein pipiens_013582, partial [Culex pipiens pipiens]
QSLCCECVTCLRTHVDITANIPKQAIVFCGRNWVRYLNPPSEWVQCSLESKELLVDAGFIWTEPHSKPDLRGGVYREQLDVRRLSPDGGEGLLVDFVQAVLPVKVTNAKKLIPHDIHSNSYNYKYSYELHVVPFSKGSLVCLRKKAAEVPVAHLAYHQSGQSDSRFRRISLKESLETIGNTKHMVEFVVTDMEIDRDNKKKNFPRQGPVSFRNVLADFWVVKSLTQGRSHPLRRELQAVVKYIRDGWPSSDESVTNSEVLLYLHRRESLSLVDGCVIFHKRVVVPNQFRHQISRQFHRGPHESDCAKFRLLDSIRWQHQCLQHQRQFLFK